jgi:hypothetical protein
MGPVMTAVAGPREGVVVVRVAQWTVDAQDIETMARFWSAALGYTVERVDDGIVRLWPPGGSTGPTVWLQPSGTRRRGLSRLHLDVASDGPAEDEVERLVRLGARRVDVGQTGREQFVVLADPEGNEFCVLDRAPRRG